MSTIATVPAKDQFEVAMHPETPPLQFDPTAEFFAWNQIMPDNYMDTDNTAAFRDMTGGWPVYTPKKVWFKAVPDPREKNPDYSIKIVLAFHETDMELVFNKTRAAAATRITGTRDARQWAALLPPLEVYVGAERDFSSAEQVLIRPAPIEDDPDVVMGAANGKGSGKSANGSGKGHNPAADGLDDLNADLFGQA